MKSKHLSCLFNLIGDFNCMSLVVSLVEAYRPTPYCAFKIFCVQVKLIAFFISMVAGDNRNILQRCHKRLFKILSFFNFPRGGTWNRLSSLSFPWHFHLPCDYELWPIGSGPTQWVSESLEKSHVFFHIVLAFRAFRVEVLNMFSYSWVVEYIVYIYPSTWPSVRERPLQKLGQSEMLQPDILVVVTSHILNQPENSTPNTSTQTLNFMRCVSYFCSTSSPSHDINMSPTFRQKSLIKVSRCWRQGGGAC